MTAQASARRVRPPGPPPRIDDLVVRHLDLDTDLPAFAELIVAVNRHDGVDWAPTAETLRHGYEHASGQDPREDILVAEARGRLVGAIETDWRVRGQRVFHQIAPWVRPDQRRNGLGRALLAWMERHVVEGVGAGSMGPTDRAHVFSGWSDLEIPAAAPFAEAAGYHVESYGVLMTRPLDEPIPDVPLPDGLEVRPVREADHRRIWDADVEAFRDHRDPAERTESDFVSWYSEPDLDTSLWEVAWDGDEVAGSVMNFVFRDENAELGLSRGWLEHVSVRRPWRKRGLASALMTRSMQRLRDLGLAEAALGADAENLSGAVRLYESLGFRRVRTAASYRKELSIGGG
ncbi:MAG TPA: GNAT family N-acetyltransferase [Candidatus Limnocylindrales bacterium]|nr:GNAT family N-acetyltransferase [Candidatus Limnocylindrales bacterium]